MVNGNELREGDAAEITADPRSHHPLENPVPLHPLRQRPPTRGNMIDARHVARGTRRALIKSFADKRTASAVCRRRSQACAGRCRRACGYASSTYAPRGGVDRRHARASRQPAPRVS